MAENQKFTEVKKEEGLAERPRHVTESLPSAARDYVRSQIDKLSKSACACCSGASVLCATVAEIRIKVDVCAAHTEALVVVGEL